ncbi:hypothetical protein D3C87_1930480 [compost metagenome]
MCHIFFGIEDLHDLVNVLIFKDVIIGYFLKEIFATGIYKLRFIIRFMFGEHENVYSYGSAVKKVGR